MLDPPHRLKLCMVIEVLIIEAGISPLKALLCAKSTNNPEGKGGIDPVKLLLPIINICNEDGSAGIDPVS